jgi:NADH dehydrogenase (ubiquinone) flavoprotein 2
MRRESGEAGKGGSGMEVHRAPGEAGSAHGGHGTETAPHVPIFVGPARAALEELFTKYPTKQACLLPVLWMVQEARGWISEPAIGEVAEVLGLTPAYVKGVVTFYTMYHTHPVGRHFIQVCTTSPCNICGAEDVMKALVRETGCGELGATSPDGRFTVIEVECLGACGFVTPILIDDDFIESVTPDKVPGILQRYK